MSDIVFQCQDLTYRYEVCPCEGGHVATMRMKPCYPISKPMDQATFLDGITKINEFGEEIPVGTEELAVHWCITRRLKYRVPHIEAKLMERNRGV